MYMKELKELERKMNSLMDFVIYLWSPKYWFPEPQGFQIRGTQDTTIHIYK